MGIARTMEYMLEPPVKNKRRAMRRKRNFIAKELKTNPLYKPQRVEGKGRVKEKISLKDIPEHWCLNCDAHVSQCVCIERDQQWTN